MSSELHVRSAAAYLYHKDKKMKHYLPTEVVVHNKKDDIWISIHRRVFNLTELIRKEEEKGSKALDLLVAFAGKDLSHWFDENSLDLKMHTDKHTGTKKPILPHTVVPQTSNHCPTSVWFPPENPWWHDEEYMIGWVTAKPRHVRFVNMLTAIHGYDESHHYLMVCQEDTMFEIMERMFYANLHVGSYTWRSVLGYIDMELTLDENGILEESYGEAPPPIFLYYNRDLTVDRYISLDQQEREFAEEIILSVPHYRGTSRVARHDALDDYESLPMFNIEPIIEDTIVLSEKISDESTQPEIITCDDDGQTDWSKVPYVCPGGPNLEAIPEEPDAEAAATLPEATNTAPEVPEGGTVEDPAAAGDGNIVEAAAQPAS